MAGVRQIVEIVCDKLFNTFGLCERTTHELYGLRARWAARVTLHNFCIGVNQQLGRPRLAFGDLFDLFGMVTSRFIPNSGAFREPHMPEAPFPRRPLLGR